VQGVTANVPMTFSYIAPSTGQIVVTTTIAINEDDNYLGNNSDTASTWIGSNDVQTTVGVPTTAAAGSTVNGTFSFANNGANATTGGVDYVATVDSGACPQDFKFTGLPTGVTAICADGKIIFTGLPDNLAASQSFSFNFSYTMPSSGSIAVNTSITALGDANSANNSASGSTNVSTTSISGTVFSDTDGSGIQNGAETGTNPGSLKVVIVDSANKVLAVATIGSDGVWTTSVPTGTGYSAYITTATPAVGSTVTTPTAALPTGWAVTGENVNGTTVDGTADGILIGINASSAVSALNFGIGQADMSVSLTNLPITAQVGASYSGSFSCTNNGPADAINATCTASDLPAGVTIGSCTISPNSPSTEWMSGTTVPVGETVTCTVSGTPTTSGQVTVTGMTRADNDPYLDNNRVDKDVTVAVAPVSDLTSSISCSPNPATAGSSVSCTLTCTNDSVSATAAATSARCEFSSGVPASGVTSNSCPATADPLLAIGDSISCAVTFTPGTAGQVTLEGTASATNESNTGNNDTSINVQVQTAAPIPTLSTYALLMLSALMGWLLLAQSGRLRRTRR